MSVTCGFHGGPWDGRTFLMPSPLPDIWMVPVRGKYAGALGVVEYALSRVIIGEAEIVAYVARGGERGHG